MRGVLVVLCLVVSGCLSANSNETEANPQPNDLLVDPLVLGERTWTTTEYDFGIMVVDDPTLLPYRYTVPLHGSLTLPSGEDAVPVIVLLHGRHGTCAVLGMELIFTGVCPNAGVITPVTSYLGYTGLAENLASHGYAVVSIDANTINDRDLAGDAGANARAQLVLRTLDEFASVNATGEARGDLGGLPADLPANLPQTTVPQAQGRLDLSRVGLMGHSRGGEGVARAVGLDDERGGGHGIDAVFALAPTDFARWPVPDVAFATLLPYCDGDVFNLQGAWMYDDARDLPGGPRYQILAMGANHNYYNSIWTGDDWGPAGEWCGSEAEGSGRDSPPEQRAHGDGLMASFFRLHVGGEREFTSYWDHGHPWPASMCPKQGSCEDRLLLARDTGEAAYELDRRGGGPTTMSIEGCAGPDCPGTMYSVAQNGLYSWATPGAVVWNLPGLPGLSFFTFRAGMPVDGDAVHLTVTISGPKGAVTTDLESHPVLQPVPGGDNAKTILNMIQVPFPNDWASEEVKEIRIDFLGTGRLHIADWLLQPAS